VCGRHERLDRGHHRGGLGAVALDELDADDDCYIPVALVAVTCEIGPGGFRIAAGRRNRPVVHPWQLNAAGLDDGTEKATR